MNKLKPIYDRLCQKRSNFKEIKFEDFTQDWQDFSVNYTGYIKNNKGEIIKVPESYIAYYHVKKKGAEVCNVDDDKTISQSGGRKRKPGKSDSESSVDSGGGEIRSGMEGRSEAIGENEKTND